MKRSWTFQLILQSLMVGWLVLNAYAVEAPALQIKTTKPGATVEVDRVIGDDKVLISVFDSEKNPLFGLEAADFTISHADRTAKVVSVKPLAESVEVPRHIVLVLDNSFSMQQRNAVDMLLTSLKEVLKIVRPIDDVHIVTFSEEQKVKMGQRTLDVEIFRSNQPAALEEFAYKAYNKRITGRTLLYEGMLAGLELIRKMPENDPRFMVVFSDGEDLNSNFKPEVVLKEAKEVGRFNAYAVDYMPGPQTDKFLTSFATGNRGQIYKATSETSFIPIFQSLASKMQYYYVLNYLFSPKGTLTVFPTYLTLKTIKASDVTAQKDSEKLEAAGVPALITGIDVPVLTLRPLVDSTYGITQWKIMVSNAKGMVTNLSGQGMPAPEVKVSLPVEKLEALVAAGDLVVSLELQDRKGQNLILTTPPVKVNVTQTPVSLVVNPGSLTIEEIKTIDASPLLGQVYFAEGSSEIPSQYVRLTEHEETIGFDEQRFIDTLEKYRQVLNIIGKRLVDKPEAKLTLVGCNSDIGKEKGKKQLSLKRAEAVRNYLQAMWKITPERLSIEVRNLPAMPSTKSIKEGQAENRRVEIRTSDPEIIAPIRSVYFATRIDASTLTVRPSGLKPGDISRWKMTAFNIAGSLAILENNGVPAPELQINLPTKDLRALAAGGDIAIKMALQGNEGKNLELPPAPVKVSFIQTSQQLAQKRDLRVQEKYALILFDFDKDTVGGFNQKIVNRIAERSQKIPQATVEIVGHTDNIGKEAYNTKLSERRALAVYRLLKAVMGHDPGNRIEYKGVGSKAPLYDNSTPEGRAFNRTVTITLEYMSAE